MNIVLFANTGLGNEVLKGLLDIDDVTVKLVVTRKLDGNFPYYQEQDLYDLCQQLGINVVANIDVNNNKFKSKLLSLKIDLIIVSSFHQIIKDDIINIPNKGIINFHPSLLPKYRGPNPLNWVLLNSEKYTGVTVHKLVKKIDAGDILLQKKYKIKPCQNLGELFKQLAILSGKMVKEVINLLSKNDVEFTQQDHSKMTYYKKPFDYNIATENTDIKTLIERLRAFVPFPGLNFRFENTDYKIFSYEVTKDGILIDKIIHKKSNNEFILPIENGRIILKY